MLCWNKRASRPRWSENLLPAAVLLATIDLCVPRIGAAETIKVGLIRIATVGPVFVAQSQGYFNAEGLNVEFVYFDSSQPIASAVVSGDIDFGVTGPTAGFYNLASQGSLRIIAGAYGEGPGFHALTYIASMRAAAAGLTSFKNLASHSVAVTQVGSPPHYSLGLLAEKYAISLGSIRILAMQSIPNIASAIAGGQADAAIVNATAAMPMIDRNQAVLLGWVGDQTPWQSGVTFVAKGTADSRRDLIERYLRAFRRGTEDFHDAFTGAGGGKFDGPAARNIESILAESLGQNIRDISSLVPYVDREARLDVKDVLRQIAWYRSQAFIKNEIDGDQVIDKRYVVPLPEK